MGMLKARTLLTLLDRLDRTDRRAALRFDSLAYSLLSRSPVIMWGAGFVTIRTGWRGEGSLKTLTRFPQFHKLANTRARLMLKALELGEPL
ncbi:hypothetical protein [Methylobacterium tarhaniae]|uniref:hypothetical protein n=1 Tax=Methylobacterium tarhaniae TaxID=1187852 RepID=UPI003D06E56A